MPNAWPNSRAVIVRMRLPFEPSLDDREPQFCAPPQPGLRRNDDAEPEPQFYQSPGCDA